MMFNFERKNEKAKRRQGKGRRKWDYESLFGYSWMRDNNESLHHGISHKPGKPDFWKNKSGHKRNMRPKKRLVAAERTKFMKQEIDEPIIKYLHRLRNASRYCEFEKLGQEEQAIEEDLIQLRLIEGMYNALYRYKIMEQLQIGNMSLNTCIDFTQQQELIQKYNHDESQPNEQIFAYTYMLKKIFKMFVLWTWTWNKKGKMSSILEDLYKLLKKTFSSSMQIQKEKRWKSWRKPNQYGSPFSKKQKQECRKNWTEEKDMLKVKINNFDLDIQMDASSEVTLIPRNFRKRIGKPTLRKSSFVYLMGRP